MPRIEEYLPETEGAGPVGGLDPKTEAVGRIGSGLEKLGQDLHEAGSAIYRQQAQSEVADGSVSTSQRNVDYQQRLIDETHDGSLDVDKFKQDYQKEVDQQAQSFSTAAGRNYFNRVSARMGARLTVAAIHGKAQIAAAKARTDWDSFQNGNANSLAQDPSSFDDIQATTEDSINARVESGAISAKDAPKLLEEAGANNAIAAVKGWARLGESQYTDKDGKLVAGTDIAKHILDSGDLDDYLKPSQKSQLYDFINGQIHSNNAAASQAERLQQRQTKEVSDQWFKDTAGRFANGTLTPQDVQSSPLPGEKQWQVIREIHTQSKEKTQYDPSLVTALSNKVLSGEITNPEELMGKVPPANYKALMSWYSSTDEGKALNLRRKTLFDNATKQIDPKSDPTSFLKPEQIATQKENVLRFQVDYHEAEKQMIQNNKSIGDLTNPNSPDYFFKSHPIDNYKVSDKLGVGADITRQNALANPITVPTGAPKVTAPPTDPAARLKSMHDVLVKKAKARASQNGDTGE